jgi:two-component system, OmpR family, sensor histidine kinase QseC
MRNPLRPSLARRVVLALLAGFLLVWATLVLFGYFTLLRQQEDDRRNFAVSPLGIRMGVALAPVEDPSQARAIVAALDRIDSAARQHMRAPFQAAIQVWDRHDRTLVYSSAPVASSILRGNPANLSQQVLNGQTYEVWEADTPRWAVLFARTPLDASWILKGLAEQTIGNILLALPCVLLPVWLVTLYGLRPLRKFSDRIAARGPEDMSPIGLTPRHAELKPLAAALDGLLTKLRRKLEAEQMFVANAAHELRTPLAVVTAQAHVLTKATDVTERVEAEQSLEAAISRSGHLVHQLLVLARMDMGHPTEPTAADLAQLVREEIAHFVPTASRRNIELTLEAPDELRLTLETHTLQSILQNLIDNAIRYGREGGKVAVELRSRSGGVVLSVADDGPGIAESDRFLIFERFYRGKNPPNAQGTGLGLAIVKQAVTRIGAELEMTGGLEGRGTCFTLEIGPCKLPG